MRAACVRECPCAGVEVRSGVLSRFVLLFPLPSYVVIADAVAAVSWQRRHVMTCCSAHVLICCWRRILIMLMCCFTATGQDLWRQTLRTTLSCLREQQVVLMVTPLDPPHPHCICRLSAFMVCRLIEVESNCASLVERSRTGLARLCVREGQWQVKKAKQGVRVPVLGSHHRRCWNAK